MISLYENALHSQQARKGPPRFFTMHDVTKFADPTVMKALFTERLSLLCPGSQAITSCTLQHVKYSPKRELENASLALSCHVGVSDGASQPERTAILYCKAFCNGQSQREIDRLALNSAGAHTLPGAPVHFPDLDLIVWVFPGDPVLAHLANVSSTNHVVAHLPYASLPDGLNGPADVRSIDVAVINYRPEQRCTHRYTVRWGSDAALRSLTLFGKTFQGSEGSAIFARSQYLWERFSSLDKDVIVARPLGYTPAVHTSWQLGIEGAPLCRAIDGSNCDSYLSTVAKGLAMVHNSDLQGLPTRTFDEHLSELDKKIEKLRRAVPSSADELAFLAQRIRHNVPQSVDIPVRPMYWDFHIDQLLAQDGKVAFLDFDELAKGDPLQDLANFIVDLHFRNLSPFLVQRMAKCFYSSYRSHVQWDAPIERIAWHATVQFINKAYRSYIQQWPRVEETVKGIIHMATHQTTLSWISKEIG